MSIDAKFYQPYLEICEEIVNNPSIFEIFRHHATYSGIVGGIPYSVGVDCVSEIKNEFGIDQELLDRFAMGDSIGHPAIYFYDELKMYMSPATMRYIRILIDLLKTFGDLSSFNIVEIGSGYGGQCKVVHDFVKPKSYTLIDLPEALALSKKYLEYFGIAAIYRNHKDSELLNYDLCISNYAFSEIDIECQKSYKWSILNCSKRGYMICNAFMTPNDMQFFREGGVTFPEVPSTCVNNFLYVWK